MHRTSMSKRVVWMLLAVHLLCISAAAQATFTPLEEVQDEYFYAAEFGDAGFSVSIPVRYERYGMIVDDADIKQLLLMEKDETKPCFTITGIRNEAYAGIQAADLTWEDLLPAFELVMEGVQEEPLLMLMEAEEEALETLTVLFPGDTDAWDIVGLRGDWLLVLTLHPQEGDEAAIELARGKMEDLAYQMLVPSFEFDIVRQIIPDDSSICITLPEGMQAIVDPYDEYGKTVYYLQEADDPAISSFIFVTTAYRDEFIGKTIEQLSEDQLSAAASILLGGIGELWNNWLPLDGEPALWIIEEISPGYGVSHLLYIKDGWLVGVTAVHLSGDVAMAPEEMTTIQLSIMLNLVRGSDAPASRDPESIALQSDAGVLEVSMPHGHLMYRRTEEKDHFDCVIINVLDAAESYLVTILQREDPQLLTMPDRPDDFAAYTEELEAAMGSRLPTHALVEEGFGGNAALVLCAEDMRKAVVVTHVDGYTVVFGITSPDMLESSADGEISKAVLDIVTGFISFTKNP